MFGKKDREIQRLQRILKSRVIVKNPEGEVLLDADFDYLYSLANVLSPYDSKIHPGFFKTASIEIKLKAI